MKETLILTFKDASNDIRRQVYRKTLKHIGENLANSIIYQFADNQKLIKFIKEHEFSSIVYTNEISDETVFLLKGLGLVQILIGIREDLIDVSDIIIDPLICKSEKYLVGTRYLLSSILGEIPAASLAGVMGIDKNTLIEEVKHNNAEDKLLNVVQLYQKLEWDTDFFGLNVGYISCLRLTPNIEKHIKNFIRRERIDLVEYLCNCHDRESVITAGKNGYLFVDIRLTFEQFLPDKIEVQKKVDYHVKKGEHSDIEKLKHIATDIYKYSRYYFDGNFDREKVRVFYQNWAEKAIRAQFDDYAYVLYHSQNPIGFCTIKKIRENAARIGLFGMDPEFTGGGLAKHLLDTSLQKLRKEEGVDYAEVVTQGRNYAAQKLYQRCGFVTKSTELWYHKWFR